MGPAWIDANWVVDMGSSWFRELGGWALRNWEGFVLDFQHKFCFFFSAGFRENGTALSYYFKSANLDRQDIFVSVVHDGLP